MRVRKRAREENKWNLALAGMAEQVASTADPEDKVDLQYEYAQVCRSAGQWEQALRSIEEVEKVVGVHPEVLMEKAKLLAKLGKHQELVALGQSARGACGPNAIGVLKSCEKEAAQHPEEPQPLLIEGYARWTLQSVTPVSKHSAVYRFVSTDRKRGTPYVRGRGRTMWHKTWHTTLLAEVGQNGEGPLPWVERDYTPISTWSEWERGSCDILIKVYPDGKATSWLHSQPPGSQVWLSSPMKTLTVPSLVVDPSRLSNHKLRPQGVMLVLAGTGIVAAAQVLHHTDPATCFGTSTTGANKPPLAAPVSLVFACREDDVLMADYIEGFCTSPPGCARLQARGGCTVRVLVSGPEAFNGAVKEMLLASGMDEEMVTILEA